VEPSNGLGHKKAPCSKNKGLFLLSALLNVRRLGLVFLSLLLLGFGGSRLTATADDHRTHQDEEENGKGLSHCTHARDQNRLVVKLPRHAPPSAVYATW